MNSNPNVDGKITAEGEFTLYDSFFEKLKDIISVEQIVKILLEDVAVGEWHDILDLPLKTPRADAELPVPHPGNVVIPISLDGTAQVKFDEPGEPSFDLAQYQPIRLDFKKLYLSNTAQDGKYLKLLIGKGDFQFPLEGGAGVRRTILVQINQNLGTGQTWTSDAFDVLNYGRVTLLGQSVVASFANGVRIQQSIDGTNWDYSTDYTAVANTGVAASVELVARYVRVSWRHAAGQQGYVRLALIARSMP